MPSPFPGMNPYLEQPDVWHDFHESFFPAVRELLLPQLRPHFIVKIDQHVYIRELGEQERYLVGRSDAHVVPPQPGLPSGAGGTAALAAPTWAKTPVAIDEEKVSFLELRDAVDRELVTVFELLSPANKQPGPDREAFLAKRRRYLASGVHYVELDLLRGWPRMPLEDLADCDYYAMVSRWELRPRAGVWPIRLRDPLPTIPIPLRRDHPDAKLDLKAALDRVYDASGYEDYIYAHTPQPPLHPEDHAWAQTIVPGAR